MEPIEVIPASEGAASSLATAASATPGFEESEVSAGWVLRVCVAFEQPIVASSARLKIERVADMAGRWVNNIIR